MGRSDDASPSAQWRRQLFWDWAAVFALLMAPFVRFTVFRGYGFLNPEVWIVFGGAGVVAFGVAVLISLRREVLRPAILAFLVLIFLFQELGSTIEKTIAELLGIALGPGLSFLVIAAPIMILFWLLRGRVSQIVAASFAALALASLFGPPKVAPQVETAQHDVMAPIDHAMPPVVHIILDQQIGIDGLVDAIPGARALRDETTRLYTEAGFRIFTGAYTHFPATLESLPNLLNGSTEPVAHRWIRPQRSGAAVVTNAWFDRLASQGYNIHVLQGHYLDFCGWQGGQVASCQTFDGKDLRVLHEIDINPVDKAGFLALYLLDIDYSQLSRSLRLGWHLTQKLLMGAGIPLPDWNAHGISPSSAIALKAVDSLEHRLQTLRRGEALVAHLYLPHHPYMLDAQCRVVPDTAEWHDRTATLWWLGVSSRAENWRARHEAYFRQSRCLNARLREIFQLLDQRKVLRDATVIVHGDHGSLITITEPIVGNENELAPIDIVSSFSTLFAIRSPGNPPGLEAAMRSIQSLFAELALGRRHVPDHNDVFLKPRRGVIGGPQTRVSMVPLSQSEDGEPPTP